MTLNEQGTRLVEQVAAKTTPERDALAEPAEFAASLSVALQRRGVTSTPAPVGGPDGAYQNWLDVGLFAFGVRSDLSTIIQYAPRNGGDAYGDGVADLRPGLAPNQIVAIFLALLEQRITVLRLRSSMDTCWCGDRWNRRELVPTGVPNEAGICPPCWLGNNDHRRRDIGSFMAHLDSELLLSTFSAPAGWAGPAVFHDAIARDAGTSPRQLAGDRFGPQRTYGRIWDSAEEWWVWLPRRRERPSSLAHFGPGCCLAALVAAVNTAHPQLFARLDKYGTLLPQLWPAAVAYAVSFATMAQDWLPYRPGRSWFFFDETVLRTLLEEAGCDLDPRHVSSTLRCSRTLAVELFPWANGYV